MNLLRIFCLKAICLIVVILAGCGGGGGEGERPPDPPQYDLTGVWDVVVPVDCTIVSGDLTAYENAQVELLLESYLLDDLGTRVVQMGTDLEITNLATGTQTDGTISGNQVRFTYSEQRMLGELETDVYEEYEGTVIGADRVALTLEASLTLQARGEMATLGALCSFHVARAL